LRAKIVKNSDAACGGGDKMEKGETMSEQNIETHFPKEVEDAITPEFLAVLKDEYLNIGHIKMPEKSLVLGLDTSSVRFHTALERAFKKTNNSVVSDYYYDKSIGAIKRFFGRDIQRLMHRYNLLPMPIATAEEIDIYLGRKKKT
jgi:hypothetical protein